MPESEKLPLDWSALDKTPFKKLLVLRCMRPDRLNVALRDFVGHGRFALGPKFVDCDASLNSVQILEDSLRDSTPATPLFFILSPGSGRRGRPGSRREEAGLREGAIRN